MIGDEIMVVSTEGIHDFGSPVLYKPYVVVGLKHRQRENWQGPETDTTYYQIEPIGMTDEERTGAMLAGGGRARPMYIFPSPSEYRGSDQWILRPGFLRGELNENNQPGLNPELKVDDIIRVIDVDGEHGRMPERFGVYKVVKVGTAYPLMTRRNRGHDAYYDIEPYPEPEISDIFSLSDTLKMSGRKTLYRGDSWFYAKEPKPITEQEQPGLSPELTYGDTILIVDIDRERENGKTQYTTPGEEMRPEQYVRYTVVDKETNGSQSKWPFRYTLVPPNQVDEYEKSLDRGWGNYEGYEKLLYPWIYEWIYANTSMANKVDRLTINEQGFSWDGTYANEIDEGNGADTSWSNDEEKITLQDILELTKDIPIINYPTKELAKLPSLKKLVSVWNPEEIERISQVDVSRQYPILIMVNEYNEVQWILDGNHRAQQAVMNDIPTIPAKLIKPSDLDERSIKMFFPKGIPTTNQTISEQDEPGFDEFSDAELEKRRTYDDFSDDEKAEIDQERIDTTPFTPLEIRILKTLHKNLDRSELQTLSTNTPEAYGNLDKKFWNIMKLFGIQETNTEDNTRESRYAKWAYDNWTKDGDYGSIEEPIKVPLKWYDVDREESGSQVEYKIGDAEVLGFDSDDAGERADYDFYAWGGEMETNDYGDYESYDSEITNSEFIKMDEGLSRVLREDIKPQTQELLFNFWRKVGPTLDPNKLKLVGFNMDNNDDKRVVWDNLKEYYGDEGLNDVIDERLEGLQDSWSYEYIVTNAEWNGDDITLDILVNGDTQIPVTQELGGAIDMSLWDINENETGDYQNDDIYEEVRDSISSDIEGVLLQDLPVYMNLDYMDISEPGTFETYVKENELEIIREEDEGYIDDMVYIDEPREKHIRRMDKDLGSLEGFPIENFKNVPPPTNESSKTEEEIGYLEDIPVDKNLVDSADEIRNHFSKFLSTKGLEYPKEELRPVMRGVKAIILKLKYHYNRPRPWQIAQEKGLKLNSETLQSSSSPSYPSGHATQGRFVARYLTDLYPEYGDELTQIGDDIAFSRNMAKVHYPSDSAFGKLLGDSMYDYVYQPQEELELQVNEQVMVDKGDMLKSDIFRILSNTFILTPTDHSEIKDSEGNYYGIYDIKQEEYVNMSDLIEGVLDFMVYGVGSGDFKEEDIEKGVSAITDWVSLMMNQKKDLVN